MLSFAEAQIGIPQILSLLDSVKDTSTSMANSLEAYHDQMVRILEANQNQTTMILSQMVNIQAQMVNTLNHVVFILEGKKLLKSQ